MGYDYSSFEKERVKTEMLEKAQNAIILCMGDNPFREVAKEKSAAAMWLKLENLYITRPLENRLYMMQRLYSFKIHKEKNIDDQIDEFIKILNDLENI